jgi:hypothetical protein
MEGWECFLSFVWTDATTLGSIEGNGCTAVLSSQPGDSPLIFKATFTDLQFTKSGIDEHLVLGFSSPLQQESNAVYTSKIGVETRASVLYFIQEPPDSVSINELFEVKIQA